MSVSVCSDMQNNWHTLDAYNCTIKLFVYGEGMVIMNLLYVIIQVNCCFIEKYKCNSFANMKQYQVLKKFAMGNAKKEFQMEWSLKIVNINRGFPNFWINKKRACKLFSSPIITQFDESYVDRSWALRY